MRWWVCCGELEPMRALVCSGWLLESTEHNIRVESLE